MKIWINIFTLLLCTSYVCAQGGFKKRHFILGTAYATCRDVVEAPDGNFIAMGITGDSTTLQPRFIMMGLNPAGDTLWTKRYGGPNLRFFDNDLHFRAPLVCDSSGIYIALCAWDGVNPRTFGVLMKCNYDGDTLWQKKYVSTDTLEDVMPQGICKSIDGGLLITGLFQWWGATATLKCLVLKTDINGNELWRKKISKTVPEVQDGKAIAQDNATKKIVVAGYQYIGNSNNWYSYGNILILDSLGNKIIQTTFTQPDAGIFLDLIQTKDGNFLVCGNQSANSQLGNLDRYRSLLVKFNLNGSKIWSREYDTLSFLNCAGQLFELENEDVIMTGYLDTLVNYNISERVTVYAYRLDKNGNVKWRRDIGCRVNNEQPMSLRPTKDGGFLLGVREPLASMPHPFNVIKIDSSGCDTLEAYCKMLDALSLTEIQYSGLSLYPNPVGERLFLAGLQTSNRILELSVTDIRGREQLHQFVSEEKTLIDVSMLPEGLYFISLFAKGYPTSCTKLIIAR